LQKGFVLTSCYSVFPLHSLAVLSVSPCSSQLVCKLSLSCVALIYNVLMSEDTGKQLSDFMVTKSKVVEHTC
jgi:hypothetical protein